VPDHPEPPEGERLQASEPRSAGNKETADERSGERLQKVLARAGLGSRRVAEDLIAEGRVTVNGDVAVLGRRVDAEHDHIALDGVAVIARDDLVYYLLNKPAGHVSTASDPQGRPTVVELVPETPRVYPVGRLDYDTEGPLLLTNDGDLTQLLTHPSFGVVKTYLAEVEGDPAPVTVRRLREGVELDDGITAPARVKVVQRRDDSAAIEIGIHEGRNRQVRRMCEAVGHPVRRLVRIRIGPLFDRQLRPGDWRPLSRGEVRRLYEAATPNPPEADIASG
jgi:23S rRNA pseudouridine2605 synthase